VSVRSTLMTGQRHSDMVLFVNAAVDDGVEIALRTGQLPETEIVSILFSDERIVLEFCDVESLERLRDLADEGARELRAAIEANAAESIRS
jgi:butyrate kinase